MVSLSSVQGEQELVDALAVIWSDVQNTVDLACARTRFTRSQNRPKPQSGAWGALRSPSPPEASIRGCACCSRSANGRSRGGFHLWGFPLSLHRTLPAPRRTATARPDEDMVCIPLGDLILLRHMRKRAQGILEFFCCTAAAGHLRGSPRSPLCATTPVTPLIPDY